MSELRAKTKGCSAATERGGFLVAVLTLAACATKATTAESVALPPIHLPPPPSKGCADYVGEHVACSSVDDETILALHDRSDLVSVNLTLDAPVDLGPLAAVRGLTTLGLRTSTAVDVSSAAAITSVETLTVGSRARGIDRLAAMPLVVKLIIAGKGEPFDLDDLRGFHQLRELDATQVRATHLDALTELPRLERLAVSLATSEDGTPLAELPALRDLTLLGASLADVEVLRGAKKLERLGLGVSYGSPTPDGRGRVFALSLPNVVVRAFHELPFGVREPMCPPPPPSRLGRGFFH